MTDTQTRAPAGSRSTPPAGPAPALGLGGSARYLWTQLTSMRTALVLLFALAVAAVPGSLVPQQKISPFRVQDFLTAHPVLGPIYDKVGLFHVYTSPWFSAIYLLLFLSLVGCIIPRVAVYTRALRSRPPRTPRNLSRLPAYTSTEVGRDPDEVLSRAAAELKRQHYRVVVAQDSVSAERGYLREAGNLVFHISLLVLLLGVAIGALFGFRGSAVVISGQGFSNNVTQYDDLSAGAAFKDTSLVPFNVVVTSFDARFETGPVQRGAARLFEAKVRVTDAPGDRPVDTKLEVNHPLNIDGTTVHLIGHGYAPRVTVRDGAGNIAFSGPVVFLPQDGNFTSAGVIKAPDGRPNRLAFQGFFTPTAVDGQGPTSVFPDALIPRLYLNAWTGPPKAETGVPENVYSLDTRGMTQIKNADGSPVSMRLAVGDVYTLPGGQGSITMDGWVRWVKLQVGDSPGATISLAAIGFAVLGLCLSLFVRPRRVWVRAARVDRATTVVEVAGLDRADARAGLDDDVHELAATLTASDDGGDPPGRPSTTEAKEPSPDMRYEYYSNVALVTSVVVYLLAMSAHAAEWASARGVTADEVAEPQQARSLVSVGAGTAGSGVSTGAPADGSADGRGRAGDGVDRVSVRQRVESFGRIGVALTLIGFALSVAGVVLRGLAAGRAPWGNMFEFTISAMVFIVAVYLVLVLRRGMRWLGLPVTLLATIGNGLAVTVFYVAVAPLVPALHSVWFLIHIVAAAISGAAFNVGGVASILYLLKKRAEDRGEVRGYLSWLPSAQRIDVLCYRFHAFAFPLWTFTVAAGSIWAEYAWGRYWGWDPKETWALVTWIVYACYLHARSTAGWKGKKAAALAILGMASFWFNFIGINLLVSGLHSYAGV